MHQVVMKEAAPDKFAGMMDVMGRPGDRLQPTIDRACAREEAKARRNIGHNTMI